MTVAPDTSTMWARAFATRAGNDEAGGLEAILALAGATDIISFAGGFPDPETFPGRTLSDIFARLIDSGDPSVLQYAPVMGLPGPRDFISHRLELLEGVRPTEDELIVTSGTIEALELLSKSLIDPGDLVLAEGPTYLGAIMAFESYEANVVAVPMDADGVDIAQLAEVVAWLGPPKLFYCIPDYQNPAGITLSAERREALVALARKHGFLIVEDVAYRELGFTSTRLPSLWSLAPDVVLQAGTFSKTFVPGVRLGWGAGPKEIVAKMIWAKQNTDQCSGALGQRLLEEYGRSGGLDEQAAAARALYGKRCGLMMDALQAHMPDEVSWTVPEGGFFTWLTLPESNTGTDLARRAVAEGVAIVPGAPFFPGEGGEQNIRLSFSRVADEAIDEGIERLASLITLGKKGKLS